MSLSHIAPNGIQSLPVPQVLRDVLERENITPEQCEQRYSDLQVRCSSMEQAYRIKEAGNWGAMSCVFRSEHPDDNRAPFVEIGLALLDHHIKQKHQPA